MNENSYDYSILPYSLIVGQKSIKMALELLYIAPRIGGVLISGHSGTGKTTAVRAFSQMMHKKMPVTLPINATEDRVIGGWRIDELMRGKDTIQEGLVEEANNGMLFIDEVNLLDDHIVNIILDVIATGKLCIQRDGIRSEKNISFNLIGTMNPEEGGLRPQLLDRFGLLVSIQAETDPNIRQNILSTILEFDCAIRQVKAGKTSEFIEHGREMDSKFQQNLDHAKATFDKITLDNNIEKACIKITNEFDIEGHRGDYVTALSAKALAALEGSSQVKLKHIEKVAPMALQHRKSDMYQDSHQQWSEEDQRKLRKLLYSE